MTQTASKWPWHPNCNAYCRDGRHAEVDWVNPVWMRQHGVDEYLEHCRSVTPKGLVLLSVHPAPEAEHGAPGVNVKGHLVPAAVHARNTEAWLVIFEEAQ